MKKMKKLPKIGIAVTFLIAIIGGYIIFQNKQFEFDVRFVDGQIEHVTKEELQEDVQHRSDESMQRFQITTAPTVHKQSGTNNLYIENNVTNKDEMKVTVILKDSNIKILDTDYIPVGKTLVAPLLSDVPTNGEYEAVAKVDFYDNQSKQKKVENEVALKIIVVD